MRFCCGKWVWGSELGGNETSSTLAKSKNGKTGCGCLLLFLVILSIIGFSGDYKETANQNNPISAIKKGDQVYVTAKSLNARSGPSISSSKVASINSGQPLKVIEERNGWLKVKQGEASLWVDGKFVSNDKKSKASKVSSKAENESQSLALSNSTSSKTSKNRSKKYRNPNKYKNGRGITNSSCPCNGGPVCVGPRGGRYCITRSGNKRYGV
jgi:uncharacterized protein YgiM (DUF1202 family)